jgi:hypothetical protein
MEHDDAATGPLRRTFVRALVLVAASLLLAGCHDEQRTRERLERPTARLPVEPDQPATPPAPALLDTVRPWRTPAPYGGNVTDTWALVTTSAGDGVDLTYRVPGTWTDRGNGRSRNLGQEVSAHVRMTNLSESSVSLATYAAQLADGSAIFQYATSDGRIVYLTRRVVAIAPAEPRAPRQVFHTAVVSVDGRIAKLDVRYDLSLDWRFDELAGAISGTLQVRGRAPAT